MVNYIKHYGIKGMKWGVRRYQNKDGSLTPEGRKRYSETNFSKLLNQKYDFADKKEYHYKKQLYEDHGIFMKKNGDLIVNRNNAKVKLTRYSSDDANEELNRRFLYMGGGKHDQDIYESAFVEGMLNTTIDPDKSEDVNDYLKRYKLKSDIKIAGAETVIKTILQDGNLDKKYKYMRNINGLYKKARLDSLKGLFDTVDDEKRYEKLQTDVKELIKKFDHNISDYSRQLYEKGYDACTDIMDDFWFAEIPIVMFYPKDRVDLI